jgi:transposase
MNYVDTMQKMVIGSLGLEEPWYIKAIEFDDKELELNIYVNVRKDAILLCPKCNGKTSRNGYEPESRRWRHGDCMFFPCYIICKRPKVLCSKCGSGQVNAPFERKNSRFTLLFEGYAMLILADMSIYKTAKLLRCNEKSLVKICKYWVDKAVDSTNLKDVAMLAIDETSFKKGHKYVTVIIDAATRAVIGVERGRDKEAIKQFAKKLNDKHGNTNNITQVTSDMSRAFVPAILDEFPDAEVTIDKFHVKKLFIDALDKVRRMEQREARDKKKLYISRRLLMIPNAKLTDEQADKVQEITELYPKTGMAYSIVTYLDDFYSCNTIETAEDSFTNLCYFLLHSNLKPMQTVYRTLIRHKDKILNYFKNRLTNAIAEGINSIIQTTKRRARGFHTFDTFATMIYLTCGKLELAAPNPFG